MNNEKIKNLKKLESLIASKKLKLHSSELKNVKKISRYNELFKERSIIK
jgi:hypothetical protein